jgi:DNA-binding response OmpR family regulator
MDKRIIVINNVGAASLIPGILSGDGYKVYVAFDTAEGLRRMGEQDYNLIVLLESPLAESWHSCERIKAESGLPLIVISSNAGAETCVKAISAGADYFIRKPFGPLELLARVGSLFQRVSSRQEVPVIF